VEKAANQHEHRWHAVAVWKWDIEEDVCGICRMPFEACCPGVAYPGDDCPPGRQQQTAAFRIFAWASNSQRSRSCV
jgi:anaphase-promoting complex subunit 11